MTFVIDFPVQLESAVVSVAVGFWAYDGMLMSTKPPVAWAENLRDVPGAAAEGFAYAATDGDELTSTVVEAAAVAKPDERRGNVVKAFVVLAEGHDPSDALAEEIKAFVRDHHSAYAYPRVIEFVPDLPKTLTGKIRRIELRQRD